MSFAKQKGWRGETEMAEWATKVSGVKYVRTPGSGAMHMEWPYDLMKRENVPSVFDGVGIEVKNTVKVALPDWIEQIKTECADAGQLFDPKWFIAFKHKGKWYFTLSQTYFEFLIARHRDGQERSASMKDIGASCTNGANNGLGTA